jgi:hypothetical protein
MRRYSSLTWEYGLKTREIRAARDLSAFLEQRADVEEFEEVALSVFPHDPEEVPGKDAEEDVWPRNTEETPAPADQAREKGRSVDRGTARVTTPQTARGGPPTA